MKITGHTVAITLGGAHILHIGSYVETMQHNIICNFYLGSDCLETQRHSSWPDDLQMRHFVAYVAAQGKASCFEKSLSTF